MTSTYSPLLRFELPGKGDQSGSWDVTMNYFMGTLLETAIAGYQTLNVATLGTAFSLSALQGTADQSRAAALGFTGNQVSAVTCTVPNVSKTYWVVNGSSQPVTIKASGTGATVPSNTAGLVVCDGAVTYLATAPVSLTTGKINDTGFATLSVSGVASLGTTPSASVPLVITSSTGAVAIDMRGRAADGISALRMMSNDGATEYARLVGSTAGLTAQVGNSPTNVFVSDASGNLTLSKTVTVGTGLAVAAGGISVVAGGATIIGDVVAYRSGATTTGAIYLGNTGGTRYLYFDGTNYLLGGVTGDLYVSGQKAWTAGNFNPGSYALLSGATFIGITYHTGGLQVQRGPNPMVELNWPGVGASGMWHAADGVRLSQTDGAGGLVSTLWFAALGTGNFVATGSVSSYSDARLKTDVQTIADALELVQRMRGVTFTRRDTGERGIGFIAQEIARVVPELVIGDPDDEEILSVSYGNAVALLVEAVKDLARRVDALAPA